MPRLQGVFMKCTAYTDHSGNFNRFVIAEIDQQLVNAVRENNNSVTINIAHADAIEKVIITDIEIFNPTVEKDRQHLCTAITEADELATAIPNVNLYTAGKDSSIVSLLAQNINPRKPQVLYATENNNYAAEILLSKVQQTIQSSEQIQNFQILNTVVGKMSGIIQDQTVIKRLDLSPMTPTSPRAILVESFNKILISRITVPSFIKGIDVFVEKDDLLPFEEAKLYGHNAIHAALGYLAYQRGYRIMSDIADDQQLLDYGLKTFLEESGAPLIKKYEGLGDELFTIQGWEHYSIDLLDRMVNPFLNDDIVRVCRDPQRKLSFNDRLIGTMQLALQYNIKPHNLALAVIAGIEFILKEKIDIGLKPLPSTVSPEAISTVLQTLWKNDTLNEKSDSIISLLCQTFTEDYSQW